MKEFTKEQIKVLTKAMELRIDSNLATEMIKASKSKIIDMLIGAMSVLPYAGCPKA